MSESEARVPPRLSDGGVPATPNALLQRLTDLGIEQRTIEHDRVYTVEEARTLRGDLPGAHVKNLFLRNRSGAMWLVTCEADRRVNLKVLATAVGAGRLSFGSEARLMGYLGVTAGSVTTFGVINDHAGDVRVVLDSALLDESVINLHPLDNGMTTALAPADLVHFLEQEEHEPQLLNFETL